jgi:hypothetical protein
MIPFSVTYHRAIAKNKKYFTELSAQPIESTTLNLFHQM